MPKKTIVFPYINGTHHIYHTITTALELSRIQNEYKILLITSTDEHKKIIDSISRHYNDNTCHTILLPPTFKFKYLNFKKKQYPYPRVMFKKALPYIKLASAVVSTSHVAANYANRYNVTKPKLIYQYHGCGDRRYGFDPKLANFDLILVPGIYHQNRLSNDGVIDRNRTTIIGWPKLDILNYNNKLRIKLFNNNKPIILYTPHWSPSLGSFKRWGHAVIDFFHAQNKYNLIFAPHVLIKHWQHQYNYSTDFFKYIDVPHIHIDLGSENSLNMTYLKIADIYMGDISSMVYEWIALKPRPCVFLNAHKISWENNVDYRFWLYGPVVNNTEKLTERIEEAVNESKYIEYQKKQIGKYMDLSEEKSSIKAAKAIIKAFS